ncbi:MAG: trypsin-like peptidase domain-containing protein [Cyanobacteria bacterium J06592_8]
MTKALESSVVRIYSNLSNQVVVGAGFLVTEKYILTCAHVVASALGIDSSSLQIPTESIHLDFPLVARETRLRAKVVFWSPVNPDKEFENTPEDIAGLELESQLPNNALPVELVTSEDVWHHHFTTFGFPEGNPSNLSGVYSGGILLGKNASGWIQIEAEKEPGYRLQKGFSGAPVWDEELNGVIGMAVAAEIGQEQVKAGFIIPSSILVKAWKILEQQATIDQYKRKLPQEFNRDIEDKIKNFCGRKFVFDEFDNFVNNQKKGYFTVIGEPGMGKSAIAAKYVVDRSAICYFNLQSRSQNRPDQFLKSIRQQLINRYQLRNAEQDNLASLLEKVRQKKSPGEKLVIVVDALDEVEQKPGANNLLNLPQTMPDGVYFLLTRRPFTAETERLYVSPEILKEELDLRASQYEQSNKDDLEEYVWLILNTDPEHKDSLKNWINTRNLSDEGFVKKIVEKSDKNFMYLRCILPEIARGSYDNLDLQKFPKGLEEYYTQHWQRMGMEQEKNKTPVMTLFVLVEIKEPIAAEFIADIVQVDEYEVEEVLEKWIEYLRKQNIKAEICYSIYHASFLDFLSGQKKLKRERKLFDEINQRIDQIFEEIDGDL